ncbi:MAG: PAS domain-containing protein [Opitutaceae bacterium]|jgi:PAS domain S-box-containing protein
MTEFKPLPTKPEDQAILQAFMHNVRDGIYFKDLKSRFIWVNDVIVSRLKASSPDEMLGKTDFDYFTPEHAQPAYDDEQTIIRTGEPLLNIEERETYPDGHVAWESTSKMPLRDQEGKIVGTFGISRDITARKEAEERMANMQKELLEASRMAGIAEISSGVLHNIGNALNSVTTSASLVLDLLARSRAPNMGKASLMLEQHLADLPVFLTQDSKGKQLPGYLIQLSQALVAERDRCRKELELLRGNVEHVKEIISTQQNYARMSHGSENLAPVELMEESIRISEASLNRHGITVIKDYQPVPVVHVARHKVLQILVNFIRNAKQAMDESGRTDKEVTISLRSTPQGRVLFMVRDNGVGIPPENLGKIFSFGFTTRKHGHGFGLHSCINAAAELDATVRCESEGVGKGAVFTLEIPGVGGAA